MTKFKSTDDININKYSPYTTKKSIVNKIKGGLENPPNYIKTLIPSEGKITFFCEGKSVTHHKITISSDQNKLSFNCDCKIDPNIETESCTHINTAVIKICLDYIDNCIYFNQNKQATLEIKNELNNIVNKIGEFRI